jgi:hypothetical protein
MELCTDLAGHPAFSIIMAGNFAQTQAMFWNQRTLDGLHLCLHLEK